MATSKSADSPPGWIAGARLFSGRPDPVWPVAPEMAHQLEEIWNLLPASKPATAAPAVPPLGYRGCFLRHSDGSEWSAFAGIVTRRSGTAAESRRDIGREFERAVLASAPAGILPTDLIAPVSPGKNGTAFRTI
jgi:hypothetical protein